ncbi:MAG: diphthine synthase [Conexivisphaerales archaeon]
MTLALIGLGVQGSAGIPLGGLEYIKESEIIYADTYTSPWPDELLDELKARFNKEIHVASRALIEDGRKILSEATHKKVALLVMGDPLLATTHIAIKGRAKEMGIDTKVFYSSSIINVIFGETGLHIYKLGRVITAARGSGYLPDSIYTEVKENLIMKKHTLVLLEHDPELPNQLSPNDVLNEFSRLETNFKLGVFSPERLLIIASRIGWSDQSICVGTMKDLMFKNFGKPPHSLLIPAEFHYTEIDALSSLPNIDKRVLESGLTRLESPSATLINRTVQKTLLALQRGRELAKEKGITKLDDIFENVECYLSDAQRFLLDGKPELALIEAGYAEGLLDSLRFQGLLKLEW